MLSLVSLASKSPPTSKRSVMAEVGSVEAEAMRFQPCTSSFIVNGIELNDKEYG